MIGLYCIPVLVLVYQDWKSREVDVLWLMILGIAQIAVCNYYWSDEMITSSLINVLMLAILLSVIYIYAKWRRIPFDHAWGKGDTLFLVILGLGMFTADFIQIIVVSCLTAVLAYFSPILNRKTDIPLISFLGMSVLIHLFIKGEGLWMP